MYFKVFFKKKTYVGFLLRNIPLHSPLKHSHTLSPFTETCFLNWNTGVFVWKHQWRFWNPKLNRENVRNRNCNTFKALKRPKNETLKFRFFSPSLCFVPRFQPKFVSSQIYTEIPNFWFQFVKPKALIWCSWL